MSFFYLQRIFVIYMVFLFLLLISDLVPSLSQKSKAALIAAILVCLVLTAFDFYMAGNDILAKRLFCLLPIAYLVLSFLIGDFEFSNFKHLVVAVFDGQHDITAWIFQINIICSLIIVIWGHMCKQSSAIIFYTLTLYQVVYFSLVNLMGVEWHFYPQYLSPF